MFFSCSDMLGEEEFMVELCNGFRLLADAEKGVITLESLKRNSGVLGIEAMNEDQLQAMIAAADLNGDGVVDENEFCVMMVRLSPSFITEAQQWLEKALIHELQSCEQ
ncbi:hypothetical protein SUGI_0659880 [Cryptomeria japonica]|uniref:calcium-binding protein KIC-like n=1 Tax=Cryptomeria japonica TaxID=3369 RepID=UPI002414978C|nr:calcium-binding protein KIC-like [Cryptomeria japonica]GLJ32770.1 hypothetical protein SUGI_0659880 [Cryptomeria japonica]